MAGSPPEVLVPACGRRGSVRRVHHRGLADSPRATSDARAGRTVSRAHGRRDGRFPAVRARLRARVRSVRCARRPRRRRTRGPSPELPSVPADRIWTLGDDEVRAFEPDGGFIRSWKFSQRAACLTVGPDGRVYVGSRGRVDIYDEGGSLVGGFAGGRSRQAGLHHVHPGVPGRDSGRRRGRTIHPPVHARGPASSARSARRTRPAASCCPTGSWISWWMPEE